MPRTPGARSCRSSRRTCDEVAFCLGDSRIHENGILLSGGAVRDGGHPLHHFKAELFKTLGHPLRLRMLELLRGGEMSVRDLLHELKVEPSTASQQLGILRAQGVVESRRAGPTVVYRLREPLIGELLDVGRRVFAHQVDDMQHLLDADARQASARRPRPRRQKTHRA